MATGNKEAGKLGFSDEDETQGQKSGHLFQGNKHNIVSH